MGIMGRARFWATRGGFACLVAATFFTSVHMGVWEESSQEIDAMHLADRSTTGWMPYRASTRGPELEEEKEYFVTCTWGTMWAWNAPQFASWLGSIGNELASLPPDHLLGQTRGIQLGFRHFIAETITVWYEREHMASFYRSGTHQTAMHTMATKIDFRARRIWVKGADLPANGDAAATKAFVFRMKNGEFREAVKVPHVGAAVEVTPLQRLAPDLSTFFSRWAETGEPRPQPPIVQTDL